MAFDFSDHLAGWPGVRSAARRSCANGPAIGVTDLTALRVGAGRTDFQQGLDGGAHRGRRSHDVQRGRRWAALRRVHQSRRYRIHGSQSRHVPKVPFSPIRFDLISINELAVVRLKAARRRHFLKPTLGRSRIGHISPDHRTRVRHLVGSAHPGPHRNQLEGTDQLDSRS
jgi:hypothetical protein